MANAPQAPRASPRTPRSRVAPAAAPRIARRGRRRDARAPNHPGVESGSRSCSVSTAGTRDASGTPRFQVAWKSSGRSRARTRRSAPCSQASGSVRGSSRDHAIATDAGTIASVASPARATRRPVARRVSRRGAFARITREDGATTTSAPRKVTGAMHSAKRPYSEGPRMRTTTSVAARESACAPSLPSAVQRSAGSTASRITGPARGSPPRRAPRRHARAAPSPAPRGTTSRRRRRRR